MDDFINSIFTWIINAIMTIVEFFLNFIFASTSSALFFAFIFMNLFGFILMYLDKKFAKQEKRRISERTLFLTAILFGSLGILAGMYKFRHKTLHKRFTIGIPLIIAIQVILVIYGFVKG